MDVVVNGDAAAAAAVKVNGNMCAADQQESRYHLLSVTGGESAQHYKV